MLTPRGRLMKTSQKQLFNKTFLTTSEQIAKLKALGMVFKNEKKSKSYT